MILNPNSNRSWCSTSKALATTQDRKSRVFRTLICERKEGNIFWVGEWNGERRRENWGGWPGIHEHSGLTTSTLSAYGRPRRRGLRAKIKKKKDEPYHTP